MSRSCSGLFPLLLTLLLAGCDTILNTEPTGPVRIEVENNVQPGETITIFVATSTSRDLLGEVPSGTTGRFEVGREGRVGFTYLVAERPGGEPRFSGNFLLRRVERVHWDVESNTIHLFE